MPSRKGFFIVLTLAVILAGCAVYTLPPPTTGGPPPPPSVPPQPDTVLLIPSLELYVLDGALDVFYFDGAWYMWSGGVWYWSAVHVGPWSYLDAVRLPKVLRKLPPDFRNRYRGEIYRVPFRHWERRSEAPPPTNLPPPSFLVRLPGPNVYLYPGVSAEVFFLDDRWYYRLDGLWYWGSSWRGPWAHIEIGHVPKPLRGLPPDWHRGPDEDRYEKVPWERFKKGKKGRGWDD